jgi:hypothetical protein
VYYEYQYSYDGNQAAPEHDATDVVVFVWGWVGLPFSVLRKGT